MQQEELARAIGATVCAAPTGASLSRKRLADKAQVSAQVSKRYLNDLEKGSANASIGILARAAEAQGLAFSSLLPFAPNGTTLPAQRGRLNVTLCMLLAGMSSAEQEGAVAVLTRDLEGRRRAAKGIALFGLRGAGKTTIGRLLAQRRGLPFVSITREIEARAGRSLADLFNLGDGQAYRSLENEVAHDLARRKVRMVLETAGGIVGNGKALDVILAAFMTVWLRATPEDHLLRVIRQGDMRPMHDTPKALEHLKVLLAQRETEYTRADCVLETSGRDPEECLADLQRIVGGLALLTSP
jgi:XRE family transcriptional regulator, aerobic/anaerobic benzoate catabolism transcriptional regulator